MSNENFPKSVMDLAAKTESEIQFQTQIKGADYNGDLSLDDLLLSFKSTGIQASNLFAAIQEIKAMRKANAKVYLGATSNMISCGLREALNYLARNKHYDVMVVTAGGIEEDLIKTFKPTYLGSYDLDGQKLRDSGWNRIGNMVINNDNYFTFEKWFTSLLNELVSGCAEEYLNIDPSTKNNIPYTKTHPLILTPSKLINFLGKRVNNEDSVLYWCYKNNISVYSPAITDGSLGDILTFFEKRECVKLDLIEDIFRMNFECFSNEVTGAIILGGGLIKHHILNGNLFKDGLDYCVIINTAHEYDSSDAGASISEAHSWGKIKSGGNCVKVHGDCSIIFPLIVYGAYKSTKL